MGLQLQPFREGLGFKGQGGDARSGHFRHPEHEEPQIHRIPSRVFSINNHEELQATIDKMVSDMQLKIENS